MDLPLKAQYFVSIPHKQFSPILIAVLTFRLAGCVAFKLFTIIKGRLIIKLKLKRVDSTADKIPSQNLRLRELGKTRIICLSVSVQVQPHLFLYQTLGPVSWRPTTVK